MFQRDRWRALLSRSSVVQDVWSSYRRHQLHRDYAARRQRYARLACERGLVYEEGRAVEAVRQRLARRGYTPRLRSPGQVHTFAFVPDLGWHRHLLPDLRELGSVTVFDYTAQGYRPEDFFRTGSKAFALRREMNGEILPALRRCLAEGPIDWLFFYASGLELSASTIRRITEETGLPTVVMCLDDKKSWVGPWMGDHRAGQIDIAASFDLCWTSARVSCEWYLVEGACPIYMPPGFDARTYRPLQRKRDIPISFVGGAYGYRPSVIRFLRENGIAIETVGLGWPGTGWEDDVVEVLNRSVINLGMGGIGYSEQLTNIKGRDFEIPGTGGGAYLTSFNPDLARHFTVGQEILCYRTRDEMLELIDEYLTHREEAARISANARARCLREHRWLHRYESICKILGILSSASTSLAVPS